MNSAAVSIYPRVRANPDGGLFGQGTLIYQGTSGFYNIRAGGRWMMGADPATGRWTYQFAFRPNNHPAFSLFTEPTETPNALYQRRPNQATGGMTETACSRTG